MDKPVQNDFQDLFVSEKIYNLVTRLEHAASIYEWNYNKMTRRDRKALTNLIESFRHLGTMLYKAHESYVSQTLEAEKAQKEAEWMVLSDPNGKITTEELEKFLKCVKKTEKDLPKGVAYQLMSDELDKDDQAGKLIFDDGHL